MTNPTERRERQQSARGIVEAVDNGAPIADALSGYESDGADDLTYRLAQELVELLDENEKELVELLDENEKLRTQNDLLHLLTLQDHKARDQIRGSWVAEIASLAQQLAVTRTALEEACNIALRSATRDPDDDTCVVCDQQITEGHPCRPLWRLKELRTLATSPNSGGERG